MKNAKLRPTKETSCTRTKKWKILSNTQINLCGTMKLSLLLQRKQIISEIYWKETIFRISKSKLCLIICKRRGSSSKESKSKISRRETLSFKIKTHHIWAKKKSIAWKRMRMTGLRYMKFSTWKSYMIWNLTKWSFLEILQTLSKKSTIGRFPSFLK